MSKTTTFKNTTSPDPTNRGKVRQRDWATHITPPHNLRKDNNKLSALHVIRPRALWFVVVGLQLLVKRCRECNVVARKFYNIYFYVT